MISIPYINPFRFQKNTVTINNTTVFPSFDNMRLNEEYQKGIHANNYYPDHLIDTEMSIIVNTVIPAYGFTKTIILPTGSIVGATLTDITPVGWLTDYVYKISYTPTIEGVHYFVLMNEYESDPILVRSSNKDLVQIQYYDSGNNYDGLFYDYNLSSWVWQPIKYYTGQIVPGEPKNEYSIYTDDPGKPIKTRSEPQDTIRLTLTDISQLELKVINRIFSCDNILLNGVYVQNTEPPELEPIEKSDLCNVSLSLTITKDDVNSYNY